MLVKPRGLQGHIRLVHSQARVSPQESTLHFNVIPVDTYWLSIASFFEYVEATAHLLATPALMLIVVVALLEQSGWKSSGHMSECVEELLIGHGLSHGFEGNTQWVSALDSVTETWPTATKEDDIRSK